MKIQENKQIINNLDKIQKIFKPESINKIKSLLGSGTQIQLNLLQNKLFPNVSNKDSLKSSWSTFKANFNKKTKENNINIMLDVGGFGKTLNNKFCYFRYLDVDKNKTISNYNKDSLGSMDNKNFISPKAINVKEKKIFVSFSCKDNKNAKELIEEVETFLRIINSEIKIYFWKCDNELLCGERFEGEIQNALEECEFGLLLISQHFLNSDFIIKQELPVFLNDKNKYPITVFLRKIPYKYDSMNNLKNIQIYSNQNKDYQSMRGRKQKEDFAQNLAEQIIQIVNKNNTKEKQQSRESAQIIYQHMQILNNDEVERIKKCGVNPKAKKVLPKANAYKNIEENEDGIDVLSYIKNWSKNVTTTSLFALLGDSGMGKTWSCMRVALDLEKELTNKEITFQTIYLDLRYFANEKNINQDFEIENIINAVLKKSLSTFAKDLTIENIKKLINDGNVFIIFDGLDEVLVHLKDEIKARDFILELKKLIKTDKNNKVLISCRTHYFQTHNTLFSSFENQGREKDKKADFTCLSLLPFNKKQILEYCKKINIDGDNFTKIIKSIHNLEEMATKPFTLRLLTEQINNLSSLDNNKTINSATIYHGIVEQWLLRDMGKHTLDKDTYKPLVMRELSYHMHQIHTREIDYKDLAIWFDKWLVKYPHISNIYINDNTSRDTLQSDIRTATFISRQNIDKFMFAHTSLQEFFLAWHIVEGIISFEDKSLLHIDMPSTETLHFILDIFLLKNKDEQEIFKDNLKIIIKNIKECIKQENLFIFELYLAFFKLGIKLDIKSLCLENVHISDRDFSTFDSLSFEGINFSNCVFYNAKFDDCEFLSCTFDGSRFNDCEFLKSRFLFSDMSKSDFRISIFNNCNFINSDISKGDTAFVKFFRCANVVKEKLNDSKSNLVINDFKELKQNAQAKPMIMQDHSDSVNSVAFSNCGKYLASASNDSSVNLYDLKSLTLIKTFKDHSSEVTSVAFSNCGKYLASASDDSSVNLYDLESLTLIKTFKDHSSIVTSVVFSNCGKYLASASWDSSVNLYDLKNLTLIKNFKDHSSRVNSVAFSNCGKYLASASYDNSVKMYDLKNLTLIKNFKDHSSRVNSVAFSNCGKYLASASDDSSVNLYDLESLTLIKTFKDHSSIVTSVVFSNCGKYLASASWDSSVNLYDLKNLTLIKNFKDHSSRVNSVAFSNCGKYLASASYDNSVKMYDLKNLTLIKKFKDHSSRVNSVAFSNCGKYLASASYDNSVKMYDLKNLTLIKTFKDHSSSVNSVAFSNCGKYLASASYDNSVKMYDLKNLTLIKNFKDHSHFVTSVVFSNCGKYLASASYDEKVKMYDLESLTLIKNFKDHSSDVNSVAFSNCGKYLASASDDSSVNLYDLESLTLIKNFKDHSSIVTSVVFSNCGKYLASASYDEKVKMYDLKNLTLIKNFKDHSSIVTSVAFSNCGKYLASASWDKKVNLYDLKNLTLIKNFKDHSSIVTSVAFSNCGKYLASASNDNSFKVYDLKSLTLINSITTIADTPIVIDEINQDFLYINDENCKYITYTSENNI